jgi:hypothetical protein
MPEIELEPDDYRELPPRKRVKLTFFEALSFSIASTLATRPKLPVDRERQAVRSRAFWMGIAWYLTHHIGS